MNKVLPLKTFFLLALVFVFSFTSTPSVFAATDTFNTTELLQGTAMDLRSKTQVSPLETFSLGPQTGSIDLDAIDTLQVQDTPQEIFFTPLSQTASTLSEDQMQSMSNFITNQIQQTITNTAPLIQGSTLPLVIQGNAVNNNVVNLYVNTPTTTATLSIPTLSQNGAIIVDNLSQTITNKTINAVDNTITNVPNAALQNSGVTINAGSGISVSSSNVGLGGAITISNTGNTSSGVSSINSQSGAITLTGSGITTDNGTITISGSGTESDTLATVTGRGATTSTALTLSSGSNSITAGTLTATGGTINGVTIGATSPTTGLFTTVNGLTIANNGSNTLNIAAGKTVAINNSITLAGTDGTTITLPPTSSSLIGTTSTDTLTNKTLTAPTINGTISTTGLTLPAFTATGNITGSGLPTIASFGSINGLTLTANATGFSLSGGTTAKTLQLNKTIAFDAGADSQTFTLPSASDTLAGLTTTQTFTKPNTFTPGSNAGVALTANATTNGTPSNIANFTQSQGGADGIDINLTNTSGTTANGLLVNLNGSGGTVTNGINVNRSAGTLTNGLVLNGIIGTDITSTTTDKGLIIKTNGAGALTLDSGTTGAINLGTGATAKAISLGNTTAGTALTIRANGASSLDVGSNTLSVQTTNGGAITLGGTTTIATGKTLAITDADKLTVGGNIIPQTIAIPVPLTAAVLTTPVFIADTTYQVTGTKCIPSILSISGTLNVTVDTGTQAAGAGTSQLTGTVNLAGTVNTVVSGTVIGSPTTINAGDRVSAAFGGTLTGLLGNCTIYLKRV